MPLPPRKNYTLLDKIQVFLIFIFVSLLGYYIFTDDLVALLVALVFMVIETFLFVRAMLKGRPFWKSFKKWLREIWDLLYGLG